MPFLNYRRRFPQSEAEGFLIAKTVRELSESEKKSLTAFYDLVEERKSMQFVANGLCHVKKMAIAPTSSLEVTNYDTDSFLAFLLKLRPIVLKTERHSFMKTIAIIRDLFTHDESFTLELARLEFAYRHSNMAYFMQISMESNPIFHPDAMQTWLNTRIFHQDISLENKMKAIEAAFGKEGGQDFFASFVSDQWDSIWYLRTACFQLIRAPGFNFPACV
jgi:hypothetical protein